MTNDGALPGASTTPDWSTPWYAALRGLGPGAWARWAAGGALAPVLNALGDAPVRFVPQSVLPAGAAYETYIHAHRAVPTRDDLHDFFNGLIWLRFPRTKQQLNALQAAELARDGVAATRGPVRDAATLFDENALLLHAPYALWNALAERRWSDVFGRLRPLWSQANALVFGHAALEKLVQPYKAITCHVWRVTPAFDPAGDLGALDDWLAADLTAGKLAAKPFAALPVLGIPGWWPANEAPAFYDDAAVFRLQRS